jgi:hypothetical protein
MFDIGERYDAWLEAMQLWQAILDPNDYDFYVRMVAEAGRPAVELGIGEGRVASAVKPDYGIDASQASLEYCRQQRGLNTELLNASFTDYEIPVPAAITYCPLNTVNMLVDPQERAACFHHVLAMTKPGGYFVFEARMGTREMLRMYQGVLVLMVQSETRSLTLCEDVYDLPGMVAGYRGFFEHLKDGVVEKRLVLPAIKHVYLPAHQIALELTESGWNIAALYGGFEAEEFTSESRRQIWVARRPS